MILLLSTILFYLAVAQLSRKIKSLPFEKMLGNPVDEGGGNVWVGGLEWGDFLFKRIPNKFVKIVLVNCTKELVTTILLNKAIVNGCY